MSNGISTAQIVTLFVVLIVKNDLASMLQSFNSYPLPGVSNKQLTFLKTMWNRLLKYNSGSQSCELRNCLVIRKQQIKCLVGIAVASHVLDKHMMYKHQDYE